MRSARGEKSQFGRPKEGLNTGLPDLSHLLDHDWGFSRIISPHEP